MLDTEAAFPHFLYSERGMPMAILTGLDETTDNIYVRVRWRGLPRSEDTLEPILEVYEDALAWGKRCGCENRILALWLQEQIWH